MAASKESSGRTRAQRLAARNKASGVDFGEALEQPTDRKVGTPNGRPEREIVPPMELADSVSRMVLDTVSEGIYCLDRDGRTTFVNPVAARMTGWLRTELIGMSQHDLVHHSRADGSAYQRDLCPIYLTLRDGLPHHREDEVFWRKDGTSFPVSYTSTPIVIDGVLAGAVVNFQDISDRIRREGWQDSKNRVVRSITAHQPLRDTLQMLADSYTKYEPDCCIAILLRADRDGDNLMLVAGSRLPKELEARLSFVRIESGVTACGEAAHSGGEFFIDKSDPLGPGQTLTEVTLPRVERCLVLPMISAAGEVFGVVAFFYVTTAILPSACLNGDRKSDELRCHGIDSGPYRSVRGLAQIAVETRKLHTALVHQTQHDNLTGLPNRLLFEDRLVQVMHTVAAAPSARRAAVCLIDIDRFRRVNENFGHLVGDELLQQIAIRLQRDVRSIDTLAREAGDEFLVLLPDLGSAQDAELICRRLLLAIASPFSIQGQAVVVSANIGICIYPDHAATPELLIQNADTAVDFAKAKGHGKLQIFRPNLGERVRQLAARETALATALERHEFYLMYQPLFDSHRRIHGFEALLRWNNPDLGLIPPDQFIPVAESTGLIIPIGEWVLKEACRQAMAWKAPVLRGTKIFVNVSALQLGQVDFTHTVSEALRVTGLPPSRLELEVTESLIVPSFKKATARLQPLQNLGVSIAIDDFGTGHSSFGVLHKLPINAIKVDRSFVARIDRDPSGLSTVRAIVDLARQLGMKTVGEGVETEEQFSLLHEMKCDYFQGYLLSRPLTPEAAQLVFENVAPLAVGYPEQFKVSA
jgi:diguanylate cyclase (GGDEF)-like protein/PAS domain S-box-containing protein